MFNPRLEGRPVVARSPEVKALGVKMGVLGRYAPQQEIYSIDECFLGLDGFAADGLAAMGQRIRQQERQWVGIPVCVGIAAPKTLTKLANHCAKKIWPAPMACATSANSVPTN